MNYFEMEVILFSDTKNNVFIFVKFILLICLYLQINIIIFYCILININFVY